MGPHPHFHIAQVNIARAKEPLDDPLLADFNAQIETVNAVADAAPGFIWRWKSAEAKEPVSDDPFLLFNLSVWESLGALHDCVYRGAHTVPCSARKKWFREPDGPHSALWWVPAGHIPSIAEALARLDYLKDHPPGPASFTFRHPFEAPEGPSFLGELGRIVYDTRVFQVSSNSANGDVTANVVFRYRQIAGRVWAHYDGPGVRFGTLVAASDEAGILDAHYSHLNGAGHWRTGRCRTAPEVLADGRLRLHEDWEWTNGDLSRGGSVVEEFRS